MASERDAVTSVQWDELVRDGGVLRSLFEAAGSSHSAAVALDQARRSLAAEPSVGLHAALSALVWSVAAGVQELHALTLTVEALVDTLRARG